MSYQLNSFRCDDEAAKELVRSLYKKGQIYPFFGSGFTKGCKSSKSTVPGVAELIEGIKKIARGNGSISSEKAQDIERMNDLKVLFNLLGRSEFIPAENARNYLEAVFTKVVLPENKRKVLNLDWPGIFTFNIDDAIERVCSGYNKILPNRDISTEFIRSHQCLFKIHGDITEYLAYHDGAFVFTWKDYAESIYKNESMLSFLGSVSREGSLAFIGCSLDAEIDIQSIAGRYSFNRSIFFKVGEISLSEQIRLEDYGIQNVIFFDGYEEIYDWLDDMLRECDVESRTQDIEILREPVLRQDIIKYIAQGGPVISRRNSGCNIARVPITIAPRELINSHRNEIARNKYTIVRGRRFSGKTTFLIDVARELTEFHTFFFPSHEVYSQYTRSLVAETPGAIFIFDANYLSLDNFKEVIREVERSNSRVVFCFDNSDYEMYRHYLSVRKVPYHEVLVSNKMVSSDSSSYSKRLNELGLPIFKSEETLLDFAYRVYDEYKSNLPASAIFKGSRSEELLKVSLLVAAFEKATSGQLAACSEGLTAIDFVAKYEILFEVERIAGEPGESVVCNSKPWLLAVIRNAVVEHSGKLAISAAELVADLLASGYKDTANSLIRFDRLNELFSSEGRSGAAGLIRQIYSGLSAACSAIPHYWLQMAKCELMAGRGRDEIENGITYARKVRADEKSNKGYTYYSATLILAQLMCKKYDITRDCELFGVILETLAESYANYNNNKTHLDKFKGQYRRTNSSVRIALQDIFNASSEFALLNKEEIKLLKANVEY